VPKNDGQGSVGSHPIAFVVFHILDNVADQDQEIQILGVINNQPLKIFKIKGDGKKRKNDQGRGDDVTDPKQAFETAAVAQNGEDEKSKKQQCLKGDKTCRHQCGCVKKKIEEQLTSKGNEVFKQVFLGVDDAVSFGIIKIVNDESCCGRKGGGQNQRKELGIEDYRPKGSLGSQNVEGTEVLCGNQQGDVVAPNHGKEAKERNKKEWGDLATFMGLEVMNHFESIALECLLGCL